MRFSSLRTKAMLATAACVLPLLAGLSLAPAARAAVPMPHQPYFGKPIEPMAAYVGQVSCHPGYLPGTLGLGRFLTATYPNTSFGGAYNCGTDGTQSEHYDGRAIDWMNSVRNPTQAAQAAAVIKYLLATDRYGNKFANARRMGVMYLIWNNKIWGSWSGQWQDYNNCARTPSPSLDSACHRNHMHISLSWAGALGRTSFWSRRVYPAQDYGPCRQADLNWAADYAVPRTVPCPRYNRLGPPAGASKAKTWVIAYSGAVMFPGMTGEPVKAVQLAFNKPVTGHLDAATDGAVNRYKKSHGLPTNGVVDTAMWRMLLRTTR